jgi:hypothetical protein
MNLKNSPLSKVSPPLYFNLKAPKKLIQKKSQKFQTPPKIPGNLHLLKGEPNVSPNQHQSHFHNKNHHHNNHHQNNGWQRGPHQTNNNFRSNKSEQPQNDDGSMFDMDI